MSFNVDTNKILLGITGFSDRYGLTKGFRFEALSQTDCIALRNLERLLRLLQGLQSLTVVKGAILDKPSIGIRAHSYMHVSLQIEGNKVSRNWVKYTGYPADRDELPKTSIAFVIKVLKVMHRRVLTVPLREVIKAYFLPTKNLTALENVLELGLDLREEGLLEDFTRLKALSKQLNYLDN